MGSAALALAYVGNGRFDAFVQQGGLSLWDVAAAGLIAERGGATVTNLAGEPVVRPRRASRARSASSPRPPPTTPELLAPRPRKLGAALSPASGAGGSRTGGEAPLVAERLPRRRAACPASAARRPSCCGISTPSSAVRSRASERYSSTSSQRSRSVAASTGAPRRLLTSHAEDFARDLLERAVPGEDRRGGLRAPARQARVAVGRVADEREPVRDRGRRRRPTSPCTAGSS